MTGGEIRIGCDGSSDAVTVRHDAGSQSHVMDDKVVVRREFGTKVEEQSFHLYKLFSGQSVKSIRCDLQGGTNSFNNMTSLPRVVQGGSGRDDMYGGSDRDVFHGNGGTDYLFGNNGRDRLYGGEGVDQLLGGEGLDGLAGGGGTDILVGGGGSDRFLLTHNRDAVLDSKRSMRRCISRTPPRFSSVEAMRSTPAANAEELRAELTRRLNRAWRPSWVETRNKRRQLHGAKATGNGAAHVGRPPPTGGQARPRPVTQSCGQHWCPGR